MKEIQLTQGYIALVDDKDFDRVNSLKWHIGKRKFYASHSYRENGTVKTLEMQRFILGITNPEIEVDHEDHNGLNNQRYNLRIATDSQNQHNSSFRKNNTSGHKGVSWKKDSGKWQVRLMHNNKSVHIGLFTELQNAANAYDEAARKYHGEFAYTNAMMKVQ